MGSKALIAVLLVFGTVVMPVFEALAEEPTLSPDTSDEIPPAVDSSESLDLIGESLLPEDSFGSSTPPELEGADSEHESETSESLHFSLLSGEEPTFTHGAAEDTSSHTNFVNGSVKTLFQGIGPGNGEKVSTIKLRLKAAEWHGGGAAYISIIEYTSADLFTLTNNSFNAARVQIGETEQTSPHVPFGTQSPTLEVEADFSDQNIVLDPTKYYAIQIGGTIGNNLPNPPHPDVKLSGVSDAAEDCFFYWAADTFPCANWSDSGTFDGLWYEVYTTETATVDPCEIEVCVSNVLFLPGIKGSRLYGSETRHWEPSGDSDIEALFLTSEGKSINSIHVKEGDIIDSAAIFEVYQSFIESMDALKTEGTINDWRPVAYDWRLSMYDVLESGNMSNGQISYSISTSSPYIEQTLRELAATSKTGKVTIVAHSNGGLVAKALLQRLGDEETAALVDDVIFVAVPQSGAPQAVGGLLYGYREGVPWQFPILSSTPVARLLAENSPVAYHLLPTSRYFADIEDADHGVVEFHSDLYEAERRAYGETIDTTNELYSFLLAAEGGRDKPDINAVWFANVLNPLLIEYAKQLHSDIDTWAPPADVTVYQIAGWGEDTVSGIEYFDLCVLNACVKKYRPDIIEDGDGVVPVPSALMMSESPNVKRYWLNLKDFGFAFIGNKDHGNVFEVSQLRDFIIGILEGGSGLPTELITIDEPEPVDPAKKLVFFLHSPLSLALQDSEGNRTGPTASGAIEMEVAGSTYGIFGDVQYITAPADHEYTLVLDGYDNGTFMLEIHEVLDDQIIASTTFANLPSTASTIAKIHIVGGIENATALEVDVDGDSVTDISLMPEEGQTLVYVPVTSVQTGSRSGGQKIIRDSSTAEPASETHDELSTEHIALAPEKVEALEAAIGTSPETAEKLLREVRASQTANALTAASAFDWYTSLTDRFLHFIGIVWSPVVLALMQVFVWINALFIK